MGVRIVEKQEYESVIFPLDIELSRVTHTINRSVLEWFRDGELVASAEYPRGLPPIYRLIE